MAQKLYSAKSCEECDNTHTVHSLNSGDTIPKYTRALDWDQVQMKLFSCYERARAPPARQCLFIERSRLIDITGVLPLMRAAAGWPESTASSIVWTLRRAKHTNQTLQINAFAVLHLI